MISPSELIDALEMEWSKDSGFLGLLRGGEFSDEGLERLLGLLNKINISEQETVNRRLVSLLWYIPIFMGWQRERLEENGMDVSKLDVAITEITNRLEYVLGVP